MNYLTEGGLNHPITTLLFLLAILVCGTAFSLIRKERGMSISATEMHVMDPILNALAFGLVLLLLALCIVVGLSG